MKLKQNNAWSSETNNSFKFIVILFHNIYNQSTGNNSTTKCWCLKGAILFLAVVNIHSIVLSLNFHRRHAQAPYSLVLPSESTNSTGSPTTFLGFIQCSYGNSLLLNISLKNYLKRFIDRFVPSNTWVI